MTDPLASAVKGLNTIATRLVNTSSNIANTALTKNISKNSSTDLAANLVSVVADKTNYAAVAKVVKAVQEDNQHLLDTLI